MNILAFDPSKSTGWCVYDPVKNISLKSGVLRKPATGDKGGKE